MVELKGHDRIVYAQAVEQSAKLNRSLDLIVKEFVEAQDELGEVSVLEAAQFYKRYGKTVTAKKNVPEVVAEMIAGLKADTVQKWSAENRISCATRLETEENKHRSDYLAFGGECELAQLWSNEA